MNTHPLYTQLYSLMKLARQEAESRLKKAGISLTPLQFWVLSKIRGKPATVNEIARLFHMRPPSLIPVVDALEQSGLLERKPDPGDRRKVCLMITKKGMSVVGLVPRGGQQDALIGAFNTLTAVEQGQLLELLQKLIGKFPSTH